jgi:putative membrane protein insertion efficiency factor
MAPKAGERIAVRSCCEHSGVEQIAIAARPRVEQIAGLAPPHVGGNHSLENGDCRHSAVFEGSASLAVESGPKRVFRFPAIWRWPSLLVVSALIGLVRLYQILLSPFLGGRCRFTPSCSAYAIEAFRKYGAIRGLFKSSWRLLRCNPFCRGGYDPP